MLSRILRDNLILICLLILSFIIYSKWFSFNIYSFGDYLFYFSESLSRRRFPSTWEASGCGGTNLLLWRYPINFVHGLFGRSGFNYNISDRFITMLPWVILSMISMYFLLKHFFKSSI